MAGTDFPDPRTVPSMLEAGVSGIPRDRAWDTVSSAEMPELAGSTLTRVSFCVLAPGEIELVGTDGDAGLADGILERFAEIASSGIAPPLEARAVRSTREGWSVAARRATRKLADVELPARFESITVAMAPDGDTTVHVDGELVVEPAGEEADVVAAIIATAGREAQAFVATLERLESGRVAFSVDPL